VTVNSLYTVNYLSTTYTYLSETALFFLNLGVDSKSILGERISAEDG